ncbi:hypothetical protein COE50_05975 [Bacillus anthracis]|nr:hypothetical protein COE50_05975 [Bacillus anthracis]
MYQIQFAKQQSLSNIIRFLKDNKARPGKNLSLHHAEKVIQQYHEKYNLSGRVSVTLYPKESEYTYDFNLQIEEDQPFVLLKAFEEDLEKDGDTPFAEMTRDGLTKAYQMEQNAPQKEGIFRNIFRFGKKKQEESSVASDELEIGVTTPDETDFEEQTKFDEQVIDHELDVLDQEMDALSAEEEEEYEEEEGDGELEDALPFPDSEEIGETYPSKEGKAENKQAEKHPPHTEVTFMDYDYYVSLQEVNQKKERYKERFTQEYLLSLLGLGKGTEMTPLKLRQVQYVKQILNSKKFILIQDKYYQGLANATDEQRLFLEQEYKTAILRDFEKEALEELEPVYKSLMQRVIMESSQYKDQEQKEVEEKKEAFKEKQRLDLQVFKAEQETSYQVFLSQLEERKNTMIQAKKDVLQKDIELQKKQVLSDKVYELKRNTQTDLVDKRNAILTEHANTIESLMNEAFESQQQALKEIEVGMQKQTPNWLQEIKNEKEAELQEKELQIKQKELSLEEKKFLNHTNGDMKEKDAKIADLQEKLKQSQRKLEEVEMKMQAQPNMGYYPMHQQPIYQPPMYYPAQQGTNVPVQQVPVQMTPQPVKKQRRGILGWLFN